MRTYLLKNFSSRSRMLFQPSLWRSRDSSLGNCSCLKSSSVPPSRSNNSTVTMLLCVVQFSSSSHFQVKTIFFPGMSSRYSPNALISSPSGLVRSQRYLPPTRHVGSDIPGPHVFWSKPLSQLLRVGPRIVNASGRRVDEPCDFERCFLRGFLIHGFASSFQRIASTPIR